MVPPRDQRGQRTTELELQRMGEQGSPELSGLGRESAGADRYDERDELLAMLTRLTLRQEDSIAALQADTSFMLYMDTAGDVP